MSDTAANVHFNRTMIYVSNLGRSVSFYTALGLQVVTADDEVVRLQDSAGTTLVLHVTENEWESVTRGCRLYFATPDAVAALDRAERCSGATVLEPVKMRDWGRRHGYILDPDGWEISVYEPEEVSA